MRIKQEKYKNAAYPIGTLIILIFIWHFAVVLFNIKPYILPDPFAIPKNFIDNFIILMNHLGFTLFETLAGFLLSIVIGVFISILIASSNILDKMLSPHIILSQSFPKTAVAPLMVIWFGYGVFPKIVMSFLIGFFPITMNMVMGLKSPDEDLLDLLKSMSATKKQIFLKVRIPASIPYFFNGTKISIPMCLVGAVVGEFVGANRGIGYLIMMANNELNTILVFSGLIALMIAGAFLYFFTEKVEKKMAPWYSVRRK